MHHPATAGRRDTRTVEARLVLTRGRPEDVWHALASPAALSACARHVRSYRPGPDGDEWTVMLSGGAVSWRQRERPRNGDLQTFVMVDGDLEGFEGGWRVTTTGDAVLVSLTLEFWLGVDGLAPLLNPVWVAQMQAHVDGMAEALATTVRTAATKDMP